MKPLHNQKVDGNSYIDLNQFFDDVKKAIQILLEELNKEKESQDRFKKRYDNQKLFEIYDVYIKPTNSGFMTTSDPGNDTDCLTITGRVVNSSPNNYRLK
jgi:hypothetical protein